MWMRINVKEYANEQAAKHVVDGGALIKYAKGNHFWHIWIQGKKDVNWMKWLNEEWKHLREQKKTLKMAGNTAK